MAGSSKGIIMSSFAKFVQLFHHSKWFPVAQSVRKGSLVESGMVNSLAASKTPATSAM